MKTIKRLAATVLLIVSVAVVGYFVFTGNQVSAGYDKGGISEEISDS